MLVKQGGVEKKFAPTATKKERGGGGSANAPHCARSASDRARPFFPLSATNLFERLPLCLFRKVLVAQRLSRIFPSGSSDGEENCLTPQLSSVVVRLVLGIKLYAFALRAMATFTLFDQVSRACPCFSPLREASGRQSEIVRVLQSPPLPLPLKSRVCRCLQSIPSP